MTETKFEEWAIIEVMGHITLAGRVSEQSIAGHAYIRVDVPKTARVSAFTKFYGPSSIYSITPVDEQIAQSTAEQLSAVPVSGYTIGELATDLRAEARQQYESSQKRLMDAARDYSRDPYDDVDDDIPL